MSGELYGACVGGAMVLVAVIIGFWMGRARR